MTIANPIYDAVFKYLMEDDRKVLNTDDSKYAGDSDMEHIVHRLLVADIASAHAPHLLGVCLVQFSEGIRIPLSAPFYQPCYLHRKHNVSIY